MLALSVKQPWIWLMTRPDIKDPERRAKMIETDEIKCIENRSWMTKFRGKIWLHASKNADIDMIDFGIRELFGIQVPIDYDYGGIVGYTEIVDCVRFSKSKWFAGPFGYVLKDSRAVKFMPLRGQVGLWETGLELGDLKEI